GSAVASRSRTCWQLAQAAACASTASASAVGKASVNSCLSCSVEGQRLMDRLHLSAYPGVARHRVDVRPPYPLPGCGSQVVSRYGRELHLFQGNHLAHFTSRTR